MTTLLNHFVIDVVLTGTLQKILRRFLNNSFPQDDTTSFYQVICDVIAGAWGKKF